MAWQDILNEFKTQFQSVGPEKYAGIDNPELRYQLAGERQTKAMAGANTATSVIATNKAKANAAAEANKGADKYTREYNKSGGYTFKDGSGKEISPWEFALAKQLPINKVLEGSYDTGDIQFLEDYDAMTMDVSNKQLSLPQAMQKLSEDYSNIFYGKGNPTPGENYGKARMQSGQERAGSVTFGDDKKYKKVQSALNQIKSAGSVSEAVSVYNKFIDSKDFSKLDEADQMEIDPTLKQIIIDLFPDALYNYDSYFKK